ncbi:MAG: hypothetical protein ACFFCK_12080, partial [Promethearchaeota archaeon]
MFEKRECAMALSCDPLSSRTAELSKRVLQKRGGLVDQKSGSRQSRISSLPSIKAAAPQPVLDY